MVLREIAADVGLTWQETVLTFDDLATADEAMTSSTTCCLLPVTRFNSGCVGSGVPGPVFQELINA